jgi:cobalt-zinc-cadmium efflux system membrane fusion protein
MSKEVGNDMSAEKPIKLSQGPLARNKGQIILVVVFLAVAGLIIAAVWMRSGQPSGAANTEHKEAKEAGEEHGDEHAEEGEHAEASLITLDEEEQEEMGLEVETAQLRATSGTFQITGAVGPNQTRQAHIRPLSRGRIEKVYVRAGDRVRAGQPLVAYDNIELGELVSEYASAKATLDKANAEAEVSKRSVERAQKLIELGAVTKAEYEKRDAEYKSALATINIQQAQVAMVEQKMRRFGMTNAEIDKLDARAARQHDLPHTILRAPFNGVVMQSEVAEGEAVDTERELFTIADISTVWVQGDVYEKDIAAIRQGQQVKVTVNAYPGETFTGRITYLSDVLDPQTRTAKVRCEVANPRGLLKLEMFATIQIPTGVQRETLMIPAAAVQQVDNESIVFVKVDENKFEKREVELGAQSDGWVEVRDGLKEGEKVVTAGAFMLKSHLKKEEFGEHEH